jgi:hypothetical protein
VEGREQGSPFTVQIYCFFFFSMCWMMVRIECTRERDLEFTRVSGVADSTPTHMQVKVSVVWGVRGSCENSFTGTSLFCRYNFGKQNLWESSANLPRRESGCALRQSAEPYWGLLQRQPLLVGKLYTSPQTVFAVFLGDFLAVRVRLRFAACSLFRSVDRILLIDPRCLPVALLLLSSPLFLSLPIAAACSVALCSPFFANPQKNSETQFFSLLFLCFLPSLLTSHLTIMSQPSAQDQAAWKQQYGFQPPGSVAAGAPGARSYQFSFDFPLV